MEISLIYPHQLFADHPALAEGRRVFLVEDPLFFGNDIHWPMAVHQQRLMIHRASMTAYMDELQNQGFSVKRICNPKGKSESIAMLNKHLPEKVSEIHVADPSDDVLGRRLERFATDKNIRLKVYPTPNFISPPSFLKEHIAGNRKPFMARFYQLQRVRLGILIDEHHSPEGGKWSYDEDNRKRLPKNHEVPPAPEVKSNVYVEEATTWVRERYPQNPGSVDSFRWPVTRKDAEAWLEQFLYERFTDFGAYEDAVSTQHAFLHHGALTPMLNIGLLDTATVVKRALLYAKRSGKIPLNSLEGFIRQIIGWREFIHGNYIHHGVAMRNGNFWKFRRRMPKSFYDGSTGIPPVDRVIRQLLEIGWCHHIERLMVLGNFMLLCRIHPDDVYQWFMEMFVDAYDWVMVPNIYGMSQFADGGIFATKPYFSGSNYIRKMSDEKQGPWCEVWDALFWTFIGDYQEVFAANHRLSMMLRTWEKFGPAKQERYRDVAEQFLSGLH